MEWLTDNPAPKGKMDGQSMEVLFNLYNHKRWIAGEQSPVSTILLENHDSLPSFGSEPILRTRASQLK